MGCGDFPLDDSAFFKALLFLASGSVILACHPNRTSSRWAVCVNLFRWFISLPGGRRSTVGTAAGHCGLLHKDEILAGAMANGHINLMVAVWSVRL